LKQTQTITQFTIVLYGTEFHKPIMANIEWMAEQGTISKEDMKLVLLTDNIDEAMDHIRHYISTNYKVKPRHRLKWLFEKR
jgi:predicted Rossmann-fold nucleotide-binding protein